jgi:hypothetical protein
VVTSGVFLAVIAALVAFMSVQDRSNSLAPPNGVT